MPRTAVFDFTDTPPEQGGARSDRVPPGRYIFRIAEVKDGTTKAGDKQMVTAWFEIAAGDSIGKRIVDRFVRTAPPNNFGWKRFHAFLLALQLPVTQKQVKLDLERLTGKLVECDVMDEQQEAQGEYPARTNSVPRAYYPYEPKGASSNGASASAPTAAPVAAVAAPAPASAPAAEPTQPAASEPEELPFEAAPVDPTPLDPVAAAAADADDLFK